MAVTALQMARSHLPVHRRKMPKSPLFPKIGGGLIGTPPSLLVRLVPTEWGVSIEYYKKDAELILHELCHALCGPASLKDERILMVVQWALMKRLTPSDYKRCRQIWGEYLMENGREIGETDFFLQSEDWKSYRKMAIKAGYILKNGHLNPNLEVPFSAWRKFNHR